MWLIRVTYRPWARYSNNDSLPIERPNSSSCLVQDTDYCNSLNLMLGSQGGRREMLVFCLYWSPEELAAKMDEGMPQQQDPWTCHWEWGQTCKKQKHPSTLFSAGPPPPPPATRTCCQDLWWVFTPQIVNLRKDLGACPDARVLADSRYSQVDNQD